MDQVGLAVLDVVDVGGDAMRTQGGKRYDAESRTGERKVEDGPPPAAQEEGHWQQQHQLRLDEQSQGHHHTRLRPPFPLQEPPSERQAKDAYGCGLTQPKGVVHGPDSDGSEQQSQTS